MSYRGQDLRVLYPDQVAYSTAIAEHLEDPEQVILAFSDAAGATGSAAWKPGRKVEVTKIIDANGDVEQAAATTTTALDIDVYNAAGDAKQADLAAKAANVQVVALGSLELVLSATDADRIIEEDETLQVIRTVVSTQGEMSLCVSFRYID